MVIALLVLAPETIAAVRAAACNRVQVSLNQLQIVLLMLTVAVSILTVVPGRAKSLQGGVHLVLFAAFLFLTIAP